MAWVAIVKTASASTVPPNLGDHESVGASFSWAAARREMAGRVDIPEVDYPKFATLGGCVQYLAAPDGAALKETT